MLFRLIPVILLAACSPNQVATTKFSDKYCEEINNNIGRGFQHSVSVVWNNHGPVALLDGCEFRYGFMISETSKDRQSIEQNFNSAYSNIYMKYDKKIEIHGGLHIERHGELGSLIIVLDKIDSITIESRTN